VALSSRELPLDVREIADSLVEVYARGIAVDDAFAGPVAGIREVHPTPQVQAGSSASR
jgi:hypothetical protein